MARSSRSMTPVAPTSGSSRNGSARRARPASSTRPSTCCISMAGRCWTCPLEDRKRLLRSVLKEHPRVRYAAHIEGEGLAFHAAAASQGLEGVVAKLRRSRYEPGRRSSAWLKIKIRPEQEFVVGGWTPGEGNARDLGAVVVGVYEGSKLRFAGKVGSGFDGKTRAMLRERLAELELGPDDPPFDPAPSRDHRGRWGGELKNVVWVKPELVIRVESAGWSRDGMVRQAAYKGIEPGRDPREVTREVAIETTAAVKTAEEETPEMTPSKPSGRRAADRRPRARRPPPNPRRPRRTPSRTWPPPRTSLPRSMRSSRRGRGTSVGTTARTSSSPTSTSRCSRPRPTTPPIPRSPSASSSGTSPGSPRRCCRTSPSGRSTCSGFPNGADAPGFWQKDIPETAPKWLRRWRETGVDGRTDRSANEHLIADDVATVCWLGNQASFEIHAWTGQLPEAWNPTFALIDIDPGEKTTWDETLVLARLYRTALGHLGVRGYPEDDRQARHPDLDPDRAEVLVRGDQRLGRAHLEGRRVHRPGSRQLGVGHEGPPGPGPPRLHPEREHQDARRAVCRATGPWRPVSPDHLGRAGRSRFAEPLDRPDDRGTRGEVGDLFAAAQTDAQELPPYDHHLRLARRVLERRAQPAARRGLRARVLDGDDWVGQVERHSLGWVTARDADPLRAGGRPGESGCVVPRRLLHPIVTSAAAPKDGSCSTWRSPKRGHEVPDPST